MTTKEVQTIDESQHAPTPYQSNALTPMDMVQKAIEGGSGIEVIEKLMALQERYDAAQARKAFDQAMAEAKAKIPTIGKNRSVKYGEGKNETSYQHEDLAQIAEVVTPILSEFGLSYRFETNSADSITVTCIISHRDGHSERNSLKSNPDGSGGKNSIQAIGSAVTYLQRYTLKAALGLAASADDDGAHSDDDGLFITDAQRDQLQGLIDETEADIVKFCNIWKIEALADLPLSKFGASLKRLEERKAKRDAANADI